MNPGTGERIEFRDRGGERLGFALTLAPCGRVGGVPHKHEASERFIVHSGKLSVVLVAQCRDLGAAESFEVPSGASHYVPNSGPGDMQATVEVHPARDRFFETVFTIASLRRYVSFRGLAPLLQMALLAVTYGAWGPFVPIPLQRFNMRPLPALARRRGYASSVAEGAARDCDLKAA